MPSPFDSEYTDLLLFVTWAAVSANFLNGVECYLADRLKPLVGDPAPGCCSNCCELSVVVEAMPSKMASIVSFSFIS
jgi:hypothetical protein